MGVQQKIVMVSVVVAQSMTAQVSVAVMLNLIYVEIVMAVRLILMNVYRKAIA